MQFQLCSSNRLEIASKRVKIDISKIDKKSWNDNFCESRKRFTKGGEIFFFVFFWQINSSFQPYDFSAFSLYNLYQFQFHGLSKTYHFSSFSKYTVCSQPMIFLLFPFIIYYIFKSTVRSKPIIFLPLPNAQFVSTPWFFCFFPI